MKSVIHPSTRNYNQKSRTKEELKVAVKLLLAETLFMALVIGMVLYVVPHLGA